MKPIRFVVKRGPEQAAFARMIKVYDWCREAFGREDFGNTWYTGFASSSTDDFVEFKFYRDEMASAFVFQWNDLCLTKDEQWFWSLISVDEMYPRE